MRASEICGLTWERTDPKTRVAHLPMTKNGHSRDVPLTRAAVDLLQKLPRMDPVFGMTASRLDANWRKLRAASAVEDLHVHDRGGSVRLNSFEPFPNWISRSVMPRPGLAVAG
ncbi:phage integrase family protein [Rhodovulum visakhapatnamense]|uniref:Phage integrase family protein n=1 Tax=Rhodovulum visakhapatnamense TaxID=364297 RepID=A0A4R8G8N0_9RHOB|nr:phage integrase family protein [Rhodovulum visakhapatnamense]